MGVYISCEEYKIIKKLGWRERSLYLALRFEMDYKSGTLKKISYQKLRHLVSGPSIRGRKKSKMNDENFHLKYSLKSLKENGLLTEINGEFWKLPLYSSKYLPKNYDNQINIESVSKSKSFKPLNNDDYFDSYQQSISDQYLMNEFSEMSLINIKDKDIKKRRNDIYAQTGPNMVDYEDYPIHSNGQKIHNLFLDFWNLYPRKVGKKQAIKGWEQMKGDMNFDKIKKNLEERTDFKTREKQFIPYPATYLRGRMWEDEDLHDGPKKETVEERSLRIERDIAEERKADRAKYGRLPWETSSRQMR